MSRVQNITVGPGDADQRLDRWLKRLFPHLGQGRIVMGKLNSVPRNQSNLHDQTYSLSTKHTPALYRIHRSGFRCVDQTA